MKRNCRVIKFLLVLLVLVAVFAGCEYPFYKNYPSPEDDAAWVSKDGSMYLQPHDGLLICQMLQGEEVVPMEARVGQGQVWLFSSKDFWRVSQSMGTDGEQLEWWWNGYFAQEWFRIKVKEGIYHNEGETITFYRTDSKRGSKIPVDPKLKEVTISTSARDKDLGHIQDFFLLSSEYSTERRNLHEIFDWDYKIGDCYEDPSLQKQARIIAEQYPLDDHFSHLVDISHYVWDLYDYLVESGMQERLMAPKYVWCFKDDYIVIKFMNPCFDADGNEIAPQSGDAIYALVSEVDGHVIHYGRAGE